MYDTESFDIHYPDTAGDAAPEAVRYNMSDVRRLTEPYTQLFVTVPKLNMLSVDCAGELDFEMVDFNEDVMDWQALGWRLESLRIYSGDYAKPTEHYQVYLRFYMKHSDETLEVRLEVD